MPLVGFLPTVFVVPVIRCANATSSVGFADTLFFILPFIVFSVVVGTLRSAGDGAPYSGCGGRRLEGKPHLQVRSASLTGDHTGSPLRKTYIFR